MKKFIVLGCAAALAYNAQAMLRPSMPKPRPNLYRTKSPSLQLNLAASCRYPHLRTYIPQRMLFNLLTPLFIVKHQQKVVIERFGKFDRVLASGLHFKLPIVEDLRRTDWGTTRIEMRERVEEMPKQKVITKDNVAMGITALVYYQIIDAEKAMYSIENLPSAINNLAQTTLRNLVGGFHLDETLTSRNHINEKLCKELGEAADKWGVKVTRVELQEVSPPEDIRLAMEREMTAERNRRAVVLTAEGEKQAAILRATGLKDSEILEATGRASARIQLAKAEADSLALIANAVKNNPAAGNYLIRMKQLETLPLMAKGEKGKTVVIPYDASPLASMASFLKEVLQSEPEDVAKK